MIGDSSNVLLDKQVTPGVEAEFRDAIENSSDDRIVDLHIRQIGNACFAAEFSLVTDVPREPAYYKRLIPEHLNMVHATVEVHACADH